MTFKESKRGLITPTDLKQTSYVMDFNVLKRDERSFFLKANDWDDFTKFMSVQAPQELLTLVYSEETL